MKGKNIYNTLDKICGNKFFMLIFIPISIGFLLVFSFTTSPLFVNDGMDSAVFKTLGYAILQGKKIYVDIFDNKGPLLFFIDAFGQWLIQGRTGIFLLQIIGLSVALIFIYKTINLFTNNINSFFVILLTLFIYGGLIQEGNQCEEWMMNLIAISFYLTFKYFKKHSDEPYPLKYSLLQGIIFAATFFIRPNDGVAWVGGLYAGIILYLLWKKEYKNIIQNIALFLLGTIIVATPICLYFVHLGTLNDMLYGLWFFNLDYKNAPNFFLFWAYPQKMALMVVFITFAIMVWNTDYKNLLFPTIPLLIAGTLLIGTDFFSHYYIVMLPFFALYLTFILLQANRSILIIAIAIISFMPLVDNKPIFKVGRENYSEVMSSLTNGQENITNFYQETGKLLNYIPEQERDQIWNYNLRWTGGKPLAPSAFSIFWHNKLIQCNKVTFGNNKRLTQEDNIAVHKPKWILVVHIWYDTQLIKKDTTLHNQYEEIMRADTTISTLRLYRRK